MFWELERISESGTGVFDAADRRFVSYASLLDQSRALERQLESKRKSLVLLLCDNSVGSLIGYIAALRSGHAAMLINASTDDGLTQRLLDAYVPEIVLKVASAPGILEGYGPVPSAVPGLMMYGAVRPSGAGIHPSTAILLSTSGTTGSPKAIRLSYRNIQANAESICDYLAIDRSETAITSLPMSYSYGLSVINSHLAAGANLICTNSSVVTPDFWAAFKERECTSFAGVPFSYEILERLRFGRLELPHLRTMTQAGGRMPSEKIRLFAELAHRRGRRFFVMYGQTEASPRIAYVPWERVIDKIGSVGIPIPGGALRVDGQAETAPGSSGEGELVYEGPNVMLGYAERREDLAKSDEMSGRLATGDVGYKDTDGFFFITGRLKRFIKIFGLRLNLDEIERMLESALGLPVVCIGVDDLLHLVVESHREADAVEAKRRVVELYKLHHSVVQAHHTGALPVNASGKKDYASVAIGLS